jgi:hypothetical protein
VLCGQRVCATFQDEVWCEQVNVFFSRLLCAVSEGIHEQDSGVSFVVGQIAFVQDVHDAFCVVTQNRVIEL